jgi:hypothetical protein
MRTKLERARMLKLFTDVLPLYRQIEERVQRDLAAFDSDTLEAWAEDEEDNLLLEALGVDEVVGRLASLVRELEAGQHKRYFD